MSSSGDYRSSLSRSIVTSSSSYHYTTTTSTSYTTTSTTTTTQSPSTIIGIHSQPYRNYLTERNHFYHSASQPTTFTQQSSTTTTSGQLRPSTIISSIQTTQTSTGNANQQPITQTPTQSKHQQSLLSSLGIQKNSFQKTDSKQSLNSQTSQHNHNNNSKMAANNKHRSNSSLQIDSAGGAAYGKTDNIDDDDDYDLHHQSACSKFLYGFLWLLAQVGLFGSVAALVFWIFKFDKGFAYQNDKRKMYNLHAFLMLTGFIFINGQSMLIYKTYLCCKKIYNKIAHAFFFVVSIGLVSFGFLIIFQAQSIAGSPDQQVQHFYSLHSWIGLVVCALFALQFLFGFITFLVLLCCDRSTAGYRARFLPTHITFGIVIFVLAIAACLSGLLQTARARLIGPTLTEPGRADYRDMQVDDFNIFLNAGIVINLVGACLLLLAILIPYLVLNFRSGNRPSTFHIN